METAIQMQGGWLPADCLGITNNSAILIMHLIVFTLKLVRVSAAHSQGGMVQ